MNLFFMHTDRQEVAELIAGNFKKKIKIKLKNLIKAKLLIF